MTTLTLEEAGRSLSSLAGRALLGEPILIQVAENEPLLMLHRVEPELPGNYLARCYGPEEIAEERHLAGFAPAGTAT